MMSIYFSVIISLRPEECLQNFGADKTYLLTHFKFAADQAFARAGLLETDEIITLQAFTIFLTGLRIHSNVRVMSTLTTLLVRLATNAGFHRDGVHFKLSPFAAEMRRRLWWAICVLDSRACEDTGYDSTITPKTVDTQVPLNLNDNDLSPGMMELPQPRTGQTQMTFSVVRFECTRVFQQVQSMSSVSDAGFSSAQYLEARTHAIKRVQSQIRERFLNHLDLSDPLSWYTSAICRIVFTKMWLVSYHPYLHKNNSEELLPSTRDWLFTESTEIVDIWLRLNEDQNLLRWKWLCETYVQWYAFAFILSELCYRDGGEEVDKAWSTVCKGLRLGLTIHSSSCQATKPDVHEGTDIICASCNLYRPLRKLWEKASRRRSCTYPQKNTAAQPARQERTGMNAQGQTLGSCATKMAQPETPCSRATFGLPFGLLENDFMIESSMQCEWPMDFSDWLLEDEAFADFREDPILPQGSMLNIR